MKQAQTVCTDAFGASLVRSRYLHWAVGWQTWMFGWGRDCGHKDGWRYQLGKMGQQHWRGRGWRQRFRHWLLRKRGNCYSWHAESRTAKLRGGRRGVAESDQWSGLWRTREMRLQAPTGGDGDGKASLCASDVLINRRKTITRSEHMTKTACRGVKGGSQRPQAKHTWKTNYHFSAKRLLD